MDRDIVVPTVTEFGNSVEADDYYEEISKYDDYTHWYECGDDDVYND